MSEANFSLGKASWRDYTLVMPVTIIRSGRPTRVKPIYTSEKLFMAYIAALPLLGVSKRITREALGMESYGRQVSLYAALVAMGYIKEDGTPLPLMHRLASEHEVEREQAIREGLRNAYPFFYSDPPPLDLTQATASEIGDEIAKHTGITGSTLKKALSFFIMVGQSAGLVFRHDVLKRHRTMLPPPGAPAPLNQANVAADALTQLMSSLPKFDPAWPDERQKQWFSLVEGFQRVVLESMKKSAPQENGGQQ